MDYTWSHKNGAVSINDIKVRVSGATLVKLEESSQFTFPTANPKLNVQVTLDKEFYDHDVLENSFKILQQNDQQQYQMRVVAKAALSTVEMVNELAGKFSSHMER